MMENRKQVNFYRLALAEGKRFRMELSDDYRLTGTGGGVFTWLAPVYDSMDQNETWHRLVLSGTFRHRQTRMQIFSWDCISMIFRNCGSIRIWI